jgi:hypothetical protein
MSVNKELGRSIREESLQEEEENYLKRSYAVLCQLQDILKVIKSRKIV